MTTDELYQAFEKYNDEYLEGIEDGRPKYSERRDLHAFMLLDKLVPGKADMVSGGEHDEIYLEVSPDELAPVVTEEQVHDLVRCGVRYSERYSSLAMFV